MFLSIIVLPLFGAIAAGFFGFFIGHYGSCIITCGLMLITFILSAFAFNSVGLKGEEAFLYLGRWISSGEFVGDWAFRFDSLTVTMLVVVLFISTLVHIYSTEYMKEDPHLSRFMSYLSLFTFFMILLVTGSNFLVTFMGWEGVGLSSYLLINFWFTRVQANKAAIKAMLVNRVGDFGLALAIFAIAAFYKDLDYALLFYIVPDYLNLTINFFNVEHQLVNFISFFIFLGAMGKSAQIGLHMWLPDAMEGPTPVSALIHAATMVTAGVFLITRTSFIFEHASPILDFVTIIGSTTAFFAATVALTQNDMKKVIAYSTCSQLGFMIFACGLSNYPAAIFHLSNHAFFKALLFLGAGTVIHQMNDEQDMRRMGGLYRLLPYTFCMFLIGSFALSGFPFLSGFYSKDLILESAYAKQTVSGYYAYILGIITTFLTSFYVTRLNVLAFITEANGFKKIYEKVHEASLAMAIPLALLAILSIFSGYYTKDLFVGFGTPFWGNSIFILPKNLILVDAEFVPYIIKYNTLVCSIGGMIISYITFIYFFEEVYQYKLTKRGQFLYTFLNKKWFFDKIIHENITQNIMYISYEVTYKSLDRGFFEAFGPTGLTDLVNYYSSRIAKMQTGYIYHYSLNMISGVILFITITFLNIYTSIFDDIILFLILVLALIMSYSKQVIDFPEYYEYDKTLLEENDLFKEERKDEWFVL